ncbi:CHAT domain-containing protein [Mastigocladopsis repens]|uniref:CHAT domain-containing protein n=1 Tax=Mastigocladopsis repens TaxID=221287 RepID=UPI0002F8F944|nr:CHAT domain-containing protein [Mastigocladopsis repens]
MLRRLWRWLKRFFQRLFGSKHPSPQAGGHTKVEPLKQPTDAEYEALFLKLLAGVNEGWSRGRVRGFLDANKITQVGLVEWLRRFGETLLVSSAQNTELASRMVQLGEVGIGEVGEVAHEIGMRLLKREGETNHIAVEDAEEREEEDAEAWFDRGVEQYMAGEFEQTIASFDRAIEFKPDFHQAWHNRGMALDKLGRFEEAIASFDRAIEFKPDFHQAWLNRGIAAGNSVNYHPHLAFMSAIAKKNPALNQRDYEGKLASYEEGLKYCQQDTHPEGWGMLHWAIGNAHYSQWRDNYSLRRLYLGQSVSSYNKALKTLTETDFPELHLEVLQDLIGVRQHLGETAKAQELQRRATDMLRRLLDECKSPGEKKRLGLKFAGFQQFSVDLAVQLGNWSAALELAEQGKKTCLSWLMDAGGDDSPKWEEIKQLLNSTTAIVYWHLSPADLHTFILKPDALSPIVISPPLEEGELESSAAVERLHKFEDWVKDWNKQYANYRKSKDKQREDENTWRDNLPELLRKLAKILDIPAIVNALNLTPQHISLQGQGELNSPSLQGDGLGESIQNVILIPHRDLHRFPLHALFPNDFTISYLPSAQIGLLSPTPLKKTGYEQYTLLTIEHPNSKGYPSLEFAQIQSEAICRMFPNKNRLPSEQATKEAVITALSKKYDIFHFTGHGEDNFNNPALSHLALAGDEKLTLADIRDFDLTSYRLVSLAACETALTGDHTITTEYVGLVSGFMGCGVAHVVSTLWTVESAASALVMMKFYELLRQDKPEVVALAAATQWLRNVTNAELAEWYATEIVKFPEDEGILHRFLSRYLNIIKNKTEPSKQPYNHPYFWAAFTITGIPSCNQ